MKFTIASKLVFRFYCACYLPLRNKKQLAFTLAGDPGIEEGVALCDSSLRKEDASFLRAHDGLFLKSKTVRENRHTDHWECHGGAETQQKKESSNSPFCLLTPGAWGGVRRRRRKGTRSRCGIFPRRHGA